MGKSPSSCFKIISCGADSTDVDDDDLEHSENKQSSDKPRWSFRKRSARHQVPSNTVIAEPQFVGFNKENPEATADKFYSVKNSSVPEKTQVVEQENVTTPLSVAVANTEETILREQTNETAPLSSVVINSEIPPVIEQANETAPSSSAVVNSEVEAVSDTPDVTTSVDANLQENVIIIQAAARRFLAQRKIQKVKNVIKLQSVVRGHLVRRQAIGTLRCVQAIVKMQALVRARHARQCQLLEKSSVREKNDEKFRIDSVHWNSDLKSNQTKHTVEKLLSNRFARQLLESSPSKTKPIYISCDPLRHDSAWQWLERWMAVTSSKVEQQQELNWVQGYQGLKENNSSAYEELDAIPVAEASMLSGSNLSPGKAAEAEGVRDSDTDNLGKFESQASSIVSDQCISFLAEGNKEQYLGEGDIKEENMTQMARGKGASGAGSQSDHDNYLNNSDFVTENLRHNTKIASSESMENEGKKLDFGSRKIRNPAFAAVQAKFEELSSAPKSSRSPSVEPKPDHSQVVSMAKNKDLSHAGNSYIQNPLIQVATSECGTEISISSTLDSPDRSDTDGGEIVIEIGTSRVANHNMNFGVSEAFSLESLKPEAKEVSTAANEFNGETSREDDENITNSIAAVDSEMVENQQENLKPESYEGSPINDVVASESHGTPSSQVSIQSTKTIKTPNNIIARKIKSKSGSKSSPSNVKNDSGHLPKDLKNANKRTSSAIAKLDNEPRRSSSSNSLPSYMQVTESARAKAHGSVSLKSSPDVHGKDDNLKKRHSLPIGDEKQGSSPRVQRSSSQTQQSSKRNNNHSPHSSAERRWQR